MQCFFRTFFNNSFLSRYLSLTPSEASTHSSSKTVSEILRQAVRFFRQQHVPEAKLSAQYLLAHVRGCSRRELLKNSKYNLSEQECEQFIRLCEERSKRTPIQYLIGNWDFRNICLTMRRPVLIPRPETEKLVDLILEAHDHKPLTFVEVGVGSGAICLSLLRERPAWRAIGIDISAEAVELTKHNAEALKVAHRLSLQMIDVHEFTPQTLPVAFVVSNPPYIPSRQVDHLEPEVINFEDRRALDGGDDGLVIIRTIISRALTWLPANGNIWLEVDLSHPGYLQDWVKGENMVETIQTYSDFTDRSRFCRLSKADKPQVASISQLGIN